MKKRVFYSELAYVLGILALAMGTAFMEKADFGMSMVVAPAYVLYLRLSQTWTFITFGMMEYLLQAVLLAILMLVMRRFKAAYLFSFVTAVIYGFALDGCMAAVSRIPADLLALRVAFYIFGLLLCALGVTFMFHTYIAPEAYELIVREFSSHYQISIPKFKTAYDIVSCLTAILLSFAFFGLWHFEGVKLGTVLCALINGWLIGMFGRILEALFIFRDALPLRHK